MDAPYCLLCIILIVTCGTAGLCVITSAIVRLCIHDPDANLPRLPVRGVLLVESEPALNISSNAISIIPYRNNTIHPDTVYIDVSELQVDEKGLHPATYAVMV
jgi:hypothetical protein